MGLWEKDKVRYFLNLLDVGLNKIPSCSKPIEELSERECDVWIKESLSSRNSETHEESYHIDHPKLEKEFPLSRKSDYLILPLSLENNATLTGTAAILEHFSNEFKIPCQHASRHFVFDETKKCYNITSARKHDEFMIMLFNHRKSSSAMEQQMRSSEKHLLLMTLMMIQKCKKK